MRINNVEISVHGYQTSVRDLFAYFFPRLQTVKSFRHEYFISIEIEYESDMTPDEYVMVVVPWDLSESQATGLLMNTESVNNIPIEVSEYNNLRLHPYYNRSLTTLVIPAKYLELPTGKFRVSFFTNERISQSLSFTERIIHIVIKDTFWKMENPFYPEGDKGKHLLVLSCHSRKY